MRLLDYPKQQPQLCAESEQELVRFDVQYLLQYLSNNRGTSYRIVEQPDVQERQSPQPDYLIEDTQTGHLIVVEHARFFESQKARKHEVSRVKRLDAAGVISMKWLASPTPQELGKRLSEFFDEKLAKGQFAQFTHAERLLLARSRWSDVGRHRLLEAEPYFKPKRLHDCDHFYLIVRGKLVQVF